MSCTENQGIVDGQELIQTLIREEVCYIHNELVSIIVFHFENRCNKIKSF